MANFDQLKQSVAALIRTNGAEEITGQIMQDVLLTIINSISGGYMFGGVAQHSGNVGNPDYNVFYLAGSGAYTGYGDAINIPNGCYGVFRYNGSWTQDVVDIGVHLTGTIREGETNGVTGDVINTALQQLFNNVMNILDTLTFTYNTPDAQKATKAMLDVIVTPTGGASHVLTTLTLVSATAAAAGLMSAEDKQKVDRMLTDFRSLSFSDTTAVADQATKIVQTLSATLGENPEAITTMTFLAATASKAGLLSAADKAKLDALWSSGYQFAGIATPSTTPVSTTSKIFYIATEAGTYFNAVTVTQGINILSWNGTSWSAVQVVGIDDEPTAGSSNLVKSGGIEKTIELRKSYLYHINGENKSSLWFTNFNTEHFHLDMDFVILPNENNSYKDIVTIIHSNDVLIDIGYYTSSGNRNWYVGERLQSSVQYYKEYHLNISYNAGLLCVFINDALIKTFSVPSVLGIIFNRIQAEPTGEMLISHLNFYDNQKFYGVDSIIEHFSATLVGDYILKEIEIMRSEQFDQIGSNNVSWIDGTIGDIQSLVFDENSLGVSSYVITYKDYVVTQPTITYNDDYQISNKPEIVITKSN